MTCPNGHDVGAGSRFCPACGAAVADLGSTAAADPPAQTSSPTPPSPPPFTPPSSPPPQPGPPMLETAPTPMPPRLPQPTVATPAVPAPGQVGPPGTRARTRRSPAVVAIAVVAVIAVIGGLVAALVLTRDQTDSTAGGSTTTTTSATTTASTTSSVSTTAAPDPAVVEAQRQATLQKEALLRLENILVQSSDGRGRVGELVTGVENCAIAPDAALREINAVIDNREGVLRQIAALQLSGDAEVGSAVAQLQAAIQASVDADRHYADWMQVLYEDSFAPESACSVNGYAFTNSDYTDGGADSSRATAAKQQFVSQYNALAQRHGLRTWTEQEI